MDVHQGALLGQHALAYTLLSFVAITMHRRLLWFGVVEQALQILPLFVAGHVVSLLVRMARRRHVPGLVAAAGARAGSPAVAAGHLRCCWRPSGARPIRTRIARCDPPRNDGTARCRTSNPIDRFRGRLLAAAAFVLLAFALLAARLVYLQVIRHDELATQAEANRIAVVPIVPNRGLIVDRNGVVLATNYSAYTLEITPRAARAPAGRTRAADRRAGRGGGHRTARPRRFKRLQEESKNFESLPIRTRLSDEEVARFTAQRFRFPGVDVKARLFRNYPLGEVGSHLLGYIGRINQPRRRPWRTGTTSDQANYRAPSTSASWAWSRATNAELHGTTGFEEVETSAGGRAVRRLDSHPPRRATPWCCRIDIKLQALVERCSATAAARWWPSTRATARCWPSSASPPSTPTCSSTASTSRAGASSTRASTSRCSTARCAAPTRRARPSSPSWRWPR
jgi:hypothetical protein